VIGAEQQVTVPKVVGVKVETASKNLAKTGFTTGTVTERASDMVGVVLEQDPEPGKEVPPSTPVNLVVGRKG